MSTDADNYIALNKANWDERAPEHARSPDSCFSSLIANPTELSSVVEFDIPLIGDITGLKIVHLQCHIATDTLSLARRGAQHVTGLDFSPASLDQARRLAAATQGSGGEKLSFVEASTYDALTVLPAESFDMVFTGIGALCWLPRIKQWAETVHALLRPGGRLFIRDMHPILQTIDDQRAYPFDIKFSYFERVEPNVFDEQGTYMKLADETTQFAATKTVEWTHGIGEIVQSVIDVGMVVTGLVEHRSVPWEALPGLMVETGRGEFELKEGSGRLPLSFTLQAVKK